MRDRLAEVVDEGVQPVDRALDRIRLAAALMSARERTTTDELRRTVRELRSGLNDLTLTADDPAAIRFATPFLDGELDQILSAQTLDRARYYLDRLLRALDGVRTSRLNDIDLNRWKEYSDILTDSLWLIDRRDTSGVHTAGYWGNFVPQIPHQMMRRYTRPGEWVLDPFAGLGTTLIEGQRLGRNTLGVELQPEVVAQARALVDAEPAHADVRTELVCGDSTSADFGALLRARGATSVQLALLHPPYHDIIRFSDDARDLSNAATTEAFVAQIGQVAASVARVLDRGRYLALVIGDKYVRGDLIPLGFLTMNAVMQQGFTLKSIIVKNFDRTAGKRTRQELWRYRALAGGFYIFKHEYIFLFRRAA